MRIKFNGKDFDTEVKHSLDFFKSLSKDESDVFIVNGFATKENIELKEGDELFCISKKQMPSKEELRAMIRARHTPKLYDSLEKASVAVCGLGGLGSHIAINLARSGVGKLHLIDFDVVEPSNLNRQAYSIDDLGKLKTEAMKEQLSKINPFIEVKISTLKIEKEDIKELFINDDIVCEAFDNAYYKAMLAQNFHLFFKDKILISASGLAGYGASNLIKTRQIAKNFFVCGDLVSAAEVGRGLIAPRVSICAAHQANLVLELLANKEYKDC